MLRLRFNSKTLFWLTTLVATFFGGRELGIRAERNNRTDPVLLERTALRGGFVELLQAESKRYEEARQEREERARRRDAMGN